MAYSRGNSTNIIVGAAALFIADTTLAPNVLESYNPTKSFRDTLADALGYVNV